jgi:hypothetical protein
MTVARGGVKPREQGLAISDVCRPTEPRRPFSIESLAAMSAREVVMTDLRLWRQTHGVPIEDMRGIVPEETNYAIGWTLSTLLTLAVVCAVWTFGF